MPAVDMERRDAWLTDYYRTNKSRILDQQAQYRTANRARIHQQQAEYRGRNRERLRRAASARYASRDSVRASAANRRERLKRQYGLTPEQYDELLAQQGGACAICGDAPSGHLHVDHDHRCCPDAKRSCGACVRGLLCGPCNLRLGWLERRSEAITVYLEAPRDAR